MELAFRKLEVEDGPLVAEMNRRLIDDEGHRNPMTLAQLEERYRRWQLAGEYEGVLFLEGEVPVGYSLFRRETEWTYIRHFFIDRPYRKRGLGRIALEWLIENEWQPSRRIRLDVLAANPSGIAFWRRCGFDLYALTLERSCAPDEAIGSRKSGGLSLGSEASSP